LYVAVRYFFPPGEQHGAVDHASDTWHHFDPGGEERINCALSTAEYLIGYDTSSGQMNSEQSLVAGTHSHGEFFFAIYYNIKPLIGNADT
jgi:hypothetical protein